MHMELASAKDISCGYFSIREYTGDVRGKDIKKCLPFAKDDNPETLEQHVDSLEPLNVRKYRWWGCKYVKDAIIQEIEQAEEISNRSNNGHRSQDTEDGERGLHIIDVDGDDNGKLSLGSNVEEMEPVVAVLTREESCLFEGSSHSNAAEESGQNDTCYDNEIGPSNHSVETGVIASDKDVHMHISDDSRERLKENVSVTRNDTDGDEERGLLLGKEMEEKESASTHTMQEDTMLHPDCGGAAEIANDAINGFEHSTHPNVDATVPDDSDVPMLLSGSLQVLRDFISEERSNNEVVEESASAQYVREDGGLPGGNVVREEKTINQNVEEINDINEVATSFSSDDHGCKISVSRTDASSKFVSAYERAPGTVSLPKSNKTKLKLHGKNVVMKKKHKRKSSDCGTSTGNVGRENHGKDFSDDDERRIKLRTVKNILKRASVLSTEGASRMHLDIDLNRIPDGPVDVEEEDENVTLGANGTGMVLKEKIDGSLCRSGVIFNLGKESQESPIETTGRGFVPWRNSNPWKGLSNTAHIALAGNSVQAGETSSSQLPQQQAPVQNYGIEGHQRASTNGRPQLAAVNETEILAHRAKKQHERGLPNAERTAWKSFDGRAFHKGFSAFSVPKNYLSSATDNLQSFVDSSSNKFTNGTMPGSNLPRLTAGWASSSTFSGLDKMKTNNECFLSLHEHENRRSDKTEDSLRPLSLGSIYRTPQMLSIGSTSQYNSVGRDSGPGGARKNMTPSTQTKKRENRKRKKAPAQDMTTLRLGRQVSVSTAHKELDLTRTCMQICSLNRNPADFSLPDAKNKYMISYNDLKRRNVSAGS